MCPCSENASEYFLSELKCAINNKNMHNKLNKEERSARIEMELFAIHCWWDWVGLSGRGNLEIFLFAEMLPTNASKHLLNCYKHYFLCIVVEKFRNLSTRFARILLYVTYACIALTYSILYIC